VEFGTNHDFTFSGGRSAKAMSMSKRKLATMLLMVSTAGTGLIGHRTATGQDKKPAATATAPPYSGASCSAPVDRFFADEVWAKVGERTCLTCHKPGGDAEDSEFVLRDPSRSQGQARVADMRHNREAFAKMAALEAEGHQSRILLKVVGKLKHGGKEQVKPDSAEYRILADFVRRVNAPSTATSFVEDKTAPPFFEGVVMVDDRKLLRRVALSLAGRLPNDAEQAAVAKQGLKAMPALLDAIMKEEAFYDRLREGFEDVFLTRGLEETDNSGIPLSYEHFGKTRHWYHDKELVKHIADEKERKAAHNKIFADSSKAIRGEPMRLIEYIVRNDRPFTDIVTADYIVVSPYSARCYGIYEELKPEFKNPDDPFEYIPVKLKALVSPNNQAGNQESATGFYPHAGLLSNFQYLRRYPTTETNRNRLRVRMYYQHFLGVNVLDLAARVTDAAAVSAKYQNPTMQASECVVCHKTIDPVAGLFQDYWTFDKGYGRRKEGWFTDMFGAGFEGEDLPTEERWRALQWLGERTAKDPRFAVAMVEHACYLLTGRKVLLPPKDLEDPLYSARRRAYQAQRKQIEAIAARSAATDFNFKNVLKDWVVCDFYRADGLATVTANPQRRAELDDVGLVRMLAPEQVERKVAAVFGQPWGKLNGQLAMLYGGIDSKEVTERAADPSGAMGAIQRILANDVACKQTALDFSRKPAERRLFPNIELDDLPGTSPEADAKIRQTIVYLHQRVLGRYDTPDSKEVERIFQLFAGIVSDAAERKGLEAEENWHCRQGLLAPVPDPHYTVRAWRGVITYLLRQHEFLYE
jgi:hypothetical protein